MVQLRFRNRIFCEIRNQPKSFFAAHIFLKKFSKQAKKLVKHEIMHTRSVTIETTFINISFGFLNSARPRSFSSYHKNVADIVSVWHNYAYDCKKLGQTIIYIIYVTIGKKSVQRKKCPWSFFFQYISQLKLIYNKFLFDFSLIWKKKSIQFSNAVTLRALSHA